MTQARRQIARLDRDHRRGCSGLTDEEHRWMRESIARDARLPLPTYRPPQEATP